ncbi:unnamed protein product [Lepeophtheirus salmonis]|uniref:(salmon louse) hypothetical protein n=1 Tax=Lepeophtheirus salmonis TaxID=72036 RepID=A0A7R8CPP9_LEPSM|nr:unnamed protein product [Lepeophtheirus salmonis]CAF2887654.1 unnamed protein product [Lepeophtheirus salmonis]
MSRTNLEDLNAKEKDNRWLQLPICPQLHADPSSSCSSEKDSSCEDYAHPSPKVLSRNKLKNGFVVCCHDYVFRHSGKGGCFKKDDCIYYHPNSTRQEMMVKIAGKVNKDIKMLYTQRLAAEQQRLIHTTAQYPYLTTGGASSFYHLHPRHSTETTAPPHHPEPHHQGSPPKADSEEGNNRIEMNTRPRVNNLSCYYLIQICDDSRINFTSYNKPDG